MLAILQVQQVASTAIFSSGAPLDLLAIRPFHNSKRHFLKWKSAATAALSAKKRNGRALSMAAQPFILTIDGVRPFCYSDYNFE